MDGGTEEPEEDPRDRVWRGGATELVDVFGPVSGKELSEEVSAVVDDPPWCPVRKGEAAELLAAYRHAEEVGEDLRAALAGAGLSAAEFPGLCGSVDGAGRAVVELGTVSVATGERLGQALRARPGPPTNRGKRAA